MFAIRGRYNSDGSTSQQMEFRKDDVTNTLTTVLKDNMVLEIRGEEMTLTVNDFFCGAGGMGLGFKNAGFRLGGAWDFDKYAVESYGHNVSPKVKQADITQMVAADIPKSDVWTFGFPCQDISNAGNQAGMIKGVTRSGLFYEVMRLLEESTDKPRIILAENVKAVKKYLPEIEKEYAAQGYKMYTVLYNSKYWGVPQNRERYFMIGVHESIDKEFVFAEQPKTVSNKLLDILEDEVDEKYYLNRPMHPFVMDGDISVIGTTAMSVVNEDGSVIRDKSTSAWVHDTDKRIGTVSARDYKQPKQIIEPRLKVIGEVDMKGMDVVKRIYDKEGLSPTLTTSEGGHRQPKILAEPKIMNVGNVNPSGRGMNGQVIHTDGLASTLTTNKGEGIKVLNDYRIRKLTPREYARLQGFPNTYEQIVSNTQFYKQMGNAVTVNVAEVIAASIKEFLGGELND